MLAEGEEEEVKELIGWATGGLGQPGSTAVDVRWRSFTGEYPDFRITD